MQYHNKTYLLNIPNWDWRRGDDAICVAELKLGFLAQNCLAPGFSTLLANLFTMRTYRKAPDTPAVGTALTTTAGNSYVNTCWLDDYMEGAGMEMYTEHFSPAFEKMTFAAAAELCFSRLRLLLIAVQSSKGPSVATAGTSPAKSVGNLDTHVISINPNVSPSLPITS